MEWAYVISIGLILFLLYQFLKSVTLSNPEQRPVVISGCDSGFGQKLALKLAAHRFPVYAGCLTEKGMETLREMTSKTKEHGGQFLHTFLLDVASDASVQHAKAFVEQSVGANGRRHLGDRVQCRHTRQHRSRRLAERRRLHPGDEREHFRRDSHVSGAEAARQEAERTHSADRERQRKNSAADRRTLLRVEARARGLWRRHSVSSSPATFRQAALSRHELNDFGVTVHILEPGFFATNITQNATENLNAIWDRVDAETKREYGESYFRAYKDGRASRLKKSSHQLEPVIDAYYHAITSRYFTKHRYWVGWDAILFYIPLATLPTFLQDAVISVQRRHRPLPAAVAKH